jgi:hypothetical protein
MFQKWFQNILPKLKPGRSVIVMDSASPHSIELDRPPTGLWLKQAIIAWLNEKDALFG